MEYIVVIFVLFLLALLFTYNRTHDLKREIKHQNDKIEKLKKDLDFYEEYAQFVDPLQSRMEDFREMRTRREL